MLKKISDNIPFLSIVLIYYAYCNLYYYYKEFKIEIYSFVSNSEILLSFLPIIVIVTATIGTYISSYIIGLATGEKNKIDRQKRQQSDTINESQLIEKPTNKNRLLITIGIILIIAQIATTYILINFQHYKRYQLREYFLYTSFIIPVFIFINIYFLVGREILYKYSYLISLFLILYIAQQIGTFRKFEAEAIKNEPSKFRLSFIYKGAKVINTMDSIVFIGQTQSSIFLYQKKDSSTLVFNRSNIDSLVYK